MTASSPRPAAPDTTGELREALIGDVEAALDAAYDYSSYRWPQQQDCPRIADDLLAGAAFRALIAERDTAVAQVQAVREVADALRRQALPVPAFHGDEIADRIRRALDGAATTGGGE